MTALPDLQYLRIAVSNPSDTRGHFIKYAYRIYNPQYLNIWRIYVQIRWY